jgi:hypothetical protein
MADDFRRLLVELVSVWDRRFPPCTVTTAIDDGETASLLANVNRMIRRAREHLQGTQTEP